MQPCRRWRTAPIDAYPGYFTADATQQIVDGDYQTRLRAPGGGPEFDRLTTSGNLMTSQLATTERTRQRLLHDLAHGCVRRWPPCRPRSRP